jgi:hypothetical protein
MGSNVGRYAKAIIAALVAGLTVLGKALKDNNGHLTASDYIAAAVAFLLALGAVYTVPNLPHPQPAADFTSNAAIAQGLNSTDQGHNVDWTPVGQGAPAVHLPRRDASGRFSR